MIRAEPVGSGCRGRANYARRSGWLRRCLLALLWVWQLPVTAAAIDDLPPGHWYEVPDSALQAVRPAVNPGGTFESIMSGWSGGVYDTKRDRLVIWGGGHSDYAGNEVYAFDINAGKWSRLSEPSPVDVSRACDYPDGLPRARHTYSYIEYLPEYDVMLSVGGSGPWIEGGGGFCQDLDAFNLATNSWEMSWGSSFQDSADMIAAWAVRHPGTGDIWRRGSYKARLMKLDIRTRKWTTYGSGGYLEIYSTPAIDPKRNILVAVGGYDEKPQIKVWDLDSPHSDPYTPRTSGERDMERASAPGFQYDPVSDSFVAWQGGAVVYTLNPDNWTWTRVAPVSGNTVTPTSAEARGTYGRFRYIPSKNAFVVVNRTNENVYFYKLPAGSD